MTATDWATDAKGTGQYAEVNGINLYFETHGTGRPLILLHGGLGSGEMFGPVFPALAERHQVIAVDLQGHGRTADIDRPIDIRLMAGDIAALSDAKVRWNWQQYQWDDHCPVYVHPKAFMYPSRAVLRTRG